MQHPRKQLNRNRLYAKKALGQNFLSDANIARRIVEKAGVTSDSVVVEIGPGLGALTIPLGRQARKVHAFEKDRQLIPLLEERIQSESLTNVELHGIDFFRADIDRIAAEEKARMVVVGNLPYNISSQVLIRLISRRDVIERATLMFQKELAERLIAPPGSRTYGRISAMIQYCADIATLMEVRANSFFPKPKIDSTVVQVTFRETIAPAPVDEEHVFNVIKAAFGKRRKTLRNALAGGELAVDRAVAEDALIRIGIDPTRRAETLSAADFVALSNALLAVPGS